MDMIQSVWSVYVYVKKFCLCVYSALQKIILCDTVKVPFTRIRFHREKLLFCSVSAYRFRVNELNAPGKRCVWKMHFKVDRFKNATRTPSSKVKEEETLLLIGMIM